MSKQATYDEIIYVASLFSKKLMKMNNDNIVSHIIEVPNDSGKLIELEYDGEKFVPVHKE